MKKKLVFTLPIILSMLLSGCVAGKEGPRGEQGPQGEAGELGPQGPAGQPGQDGTSVITGEGEPSDEIGNVGDSYIDLLTWNYYVKGMNGWIFKGNIKGNDGATGPQGPAGKNGVSVVSIIKTDSDGLNDIYTITYSDGTTSTFVVTNGANGQQGIQGNPGADGHTPMITIGGNGNWFVDGEDTGFSAQGPQGETGVSIISTYINDDGDLIVEFSDGTTSNAGHIKDVDVCTVRFHVDDEIITTRNVVSGSKVSRPSLEETAGYTINNWYYLDGSIHEDWKFFGYVITEDIDLYADFSYNTYTISFNDEFEHTISDLVVTYDHQYTLEEISQTGYTFAGWADNYGVIWDTEGIYRTSSNITLHAVWNANTYVVTLNANGGSVSPTTKNVVFNHTYNLPIPTKSHYHFLGWYDGTTKVSNNATWKYVENKTFVAQWTNESNTYVLDAGDGECSIDSLVINYDEEYNLPIPTKDGYSFLGWFYGNNQIPLSGTWKYENTDGSLGGIIVAQWTSGKISDPKFTYESGYYRLTSCYPIGNKLDIPSQVNGKIIKRISDGAVQNSDTIMSISIPFTGTYRGIADERIKYLKHFGAIFGYISKVSDKTPPDGYIYVGTTYDSSTIKHTHYFCKQTNIKIVNIIGEDFSAFDDSAFYGCNSIERINFVNAITSIGKNAFYNCSSLTSISLPDGLTVIKESAFYNCSSLTSAIIPDGVTVQAKSFTGCTSLEFNVYDNACYLGNESNGYIYLIKAIGTSITSCTINENCRYIVPEAFSRCSKLTSISLPDGLVSIGHYAFEDCSSLKSIIIPNSVKIIGGYAFRYCTSLRSIVIPDSVIVVGYRAFCDCKISTIYCCSNSKPDGWDNDWNLDCSAVVNWGYTE
ncbi:MAG: leucine-rich repeat protein [Bacilli bacterium]|nr:leucine-rich repeat protein [Bacilli bacterium]